MERELEDGPLGTEVRARRTGLGSRLRARWGERVSDPTARARRRQLRRWFGVGVVVLLLVTALVTLAIRDVRQSALLSELQKEAAGSGVESPVGFAEKCVIVWLASGSGRGEAAALESDCGLSIDPQDLSGMEAGALRVRSAYGDSGAPGTYLVPSEIPGFAVWSVRVCVELEGQVTPQSEGGDEGAALLGRPCFRVPVSQRVGSPEDPDHLELALVSTPKAVAFSPDQDAPVVGVAMRGSDPNDPREVQIAGYLRAYLLRPAEGREAEGSVAPFLSPEASSSVVHVPSIADVVVGKVGYGDEVDGRQDAVVYALVTYRGGVSALQTFAFTLERTNDRWSILEVPSTPVLGLRS